MQWKTDIKIENSDYSLITYFKWNTNGIHVITQYIIYEYIYINIYICVILKKGKATY